MWVADTTTDAPLPPAERTETAGRFVVGWPAPATTVTLASTTAAPGDPITASASGLLPDEPISVWWTPPDNGPAIGAGLAATADDAGDIIISVTLPPDAAPGVWHLTIAGQRSRRSGLANVEIGW